MRNGAQGVKMYVDIKLTVPVVQVIVKNIHMKFDIKNINIEICGSWSNWKTFHKMSILRLTKKKFIWFFNIELAPKEYFFKFLINKKWILDPTRLTKKLGEIENHFFGPLQAFNQKRQSIFYMKILKEQKIRYQVFECTNLKYGGVWGHSMNLIGNKIYVLGGVGRNSYTNKIYEIDPMTWKVELIEMCDENGPEELGFHRALNYGEKLIIYNGFSSRHHANSYFTFNTVTKKWTNYKFKHLEKKELFTAVYLEDTERIYFFGGFYFHPDSKKEKNFNDLTVLHLELMLFEKLEAKNSPQPRCHHTANIVRSKMYVFGGCQIDQYKKLFFNDVQVIDLKDHQNLEWNELKIDSKAPCPRYGHIALGYGENLIIHGGKATQGEFSFKEKYFSDIWILDIKASLWFSLDYDKAPILRAHHAGIVWENNMIIFGGKSECKGLNNLSYKIFKIPLKTIKSHYSDLRC